MTNEAPSKSKYIRLLVAALRANAVFSFACGLALAAWSSPMAAWTGFPASNWLRLIGLGLVGFGIVLWLFAARGAKPRAGAVLVSALDLAWVLVTSSLALGVPALFNTTGVTLVLATAVVVLVFFELQAYALWRTRRRDHTAA